MAEENAISPYAGREVDQCFFKGESSRVLRGVIVQVSSVEQAKIAEEAGACCVLLSEPIHIGIMRMPDPLLFIEIKRVVSVPVIVKVRVGHFVEAQILDNVGVKHFDESDETSAVDQEHFINKHRFKESYFVCGCRSLGEALRRVKEGAKMIKTQGDMAAYSSGNNITETLRNVRSAINYAAGGIATPADAALMMQLGCDGIFVGLEIFQFSKPCDRLRGIVQAVKGYNDPSVLAQASFGVGAI